MTIWDGIFPLGLGTNRFPIQDAEDEKGIEESADIVLAALDAGVDFIDVTHTYARGMALEAVKRALKRTSSRPGITLKTRLDLDKTADDVRRRADFVLNELETDKLKYFFAWSVFSLEELHQIMLPGGLYDGAVRLKDEGIVEHICCSTHARPEEIVKIIESGAFEGITISFSLITALRYGDVLRAAGENGVALAAMNPLGGGMVPKNPDFFSFACMDKEEDTVSAALRFVKAHPEIQIVLSGVSSKDELDANIRTLTEPSRETDSVRISRATERIQGLDGFCTGCRYCARCPKGIPIPEIMQSRNNLLFEADDTTYQAKSRQTLEDIQFLSKLQCDFSVLFDTPDNPCIRCGKCESVCTQRLPIMDAMKDTYQRAGRSGFSVQARRQRLDALFNGHGYRKVGMYPGGIYTQSVLRAYSDFFGNPDFGICIFDGNPAVWGTADAGHTVYSPADIPKEKPDCIVITSYKFKNEIYDSICKYEAEGIVIVKLHPDTDVPWLF